MIFSLLFACADEADDTSAGSGDTAAEAYFCEAGPGLICRYAGTGNQALGADDIPATESHLYLPLDITIGPDGAGYLLDWSNHRIRRVDPDTGIVTTIAGVAFIGDGPEGPAETAALNHPTHIQFGTDGNLYFAAWHNSRVDMIDMSTMTLSFLAGNGKREFTGDDGPAMEAALNLPSATAFGPDGTLYISDQANFRIRALDAAGMITTFAGTGEKGYGGDGGPAKDALFHAGSGQEATPGSRILVKDNLLYIADTQNNRIRVIDLDTTIIETIAGNGIAGAEGDGGPATEASLFGPTDIALGPNGELYIADTENDCVRVVHADGNLTTFAGTCGAPGDAGDGGPTHESKLHHPYGVSTDPEGNVYISDTYNNVVRVAYAEDPPELME